MQTFEMHTFGLFAKRLTMQLSLCLSSEESFILIALTRTVSVWVSLNNLKIFHPHQSFAVRFPSQTDCWRPFVVRRVTIRESQSQSLNGLPDVPLMLSADDHCQELSNFLGKFQFECNDKQSLSLKMQISAIGLECKLGIASDCLARRSPQSLSMENLFGFLSDFKHFVFAFFGLIVDDACIVW